MKQKLHSGEDTGLKDKDGNPIVVHSYIADASGAVYHVNSFCQAVPNGDGAATSLESLVSQGGVRSLSAQEVLSIQSNTGRLPEKKPRKYRRKAVLPEEAPEAEPTTVPEEKPAEKAEEAALPVDLAFILKTVPDRILAEELRRRGYAFTAVKPILLTV